MLHKWGLPVFVATNASSPSYIQNFSFRVWQLIDICYYFTCRVLFLVSPWICRTTLCSLILHILAVFPFNTSCFQSLLHLCSCLKNTDHAHLHKFLYIFFVVVLLLLVVLLASREEDRHGWIENFSWGSRSKRESTFCGRRDRWLRENKQMLLGCAGRKLERQKPSLNSTWPLGRKEQ